MSVPETVPAPQGAAPGLLRRLAGLSLTTKIMIAAVLGLALGAVTGGSLNDVRVLGDVWMRLIQMVVPVLILGSVTEAIGRIDRRSVGKIGGKTILFFCATTLTAAILSVVVNRFLITPGRGLYFPGLAEYAVEIPEGQGFRDIVLSFFGTNIVGSMAAGTIVHVIVFAIVLGLAISAYVHTTGNESVLEGIHRANQVVMGMIKLVMRTAPLGVFGFMVWVAGDTGLDVITPLLTYLVSILAVVVVYQAILFTAVSAYCKVNPLRTVKHCMQALLIASTTTSSAMALPQAMKDAHEKLGVSKRIANIVNPLGINLNADGQVLFTTAATILLANVLGMELTFSHMVTIIVITTLATFGVLAVPGGALVVLAGLLPQFGIPAEAVAIIAGVDWFRGMITTPANITGDMLAGMVVARSEGEFHRDVFEGRITAAEAERRHAAPAAPRTPAVTAPGGDLVPA